jgi:hypothetical protein
MKDSPSPPPGVSAVCGGGDRTRSMVSSGKSIFVILCLDTVRFFRFLLALRKLMRSTISWNFPNEVSKEKSLCLYVHGSKSLASKGPRPFELCSLILLIKSPTLMSACTTNSAILPKLSLPSWSTRRYGIVFSCACASAGFSACFPLACFCLVAGMMRVASGGVKRDGLIIKDHMTISRDVSSITCLATPFSGTFSHPGLCASISNSIISDCWLCIGGVGSGTGTSIGPSLHSCYCAQVKGLPC